MENSQYFQPMDPSLLINSILQQAISTSASDIHIEPERGSLNIRLRIDGILYPLSGLLETTPDEVISKIKVMAQMNIMEKRLPQDGHLEFSYLDKQFNFRVSTTPTIYGEAVVLRMLNREGIIVDLENLGFSPPQLELVTRTINQPYGIVLITGPTGSGKTTLLYSFLSILNKQQRNIITLEDPVEYQMANIRQMQINETIGWSFAKGMRAVVRQDPDIIMLGEIRDAETATMAFQAALAGRLVFSTFHTFDVPGIIIRLIEMGIPRSVLAHALTGVVSSKLVRKICEACAVTVPATGAELKILNLTSGQQNLKKARGCEVCHTCGYLGRVGIFEILFFDEEIKENIMQERPEIPLYKLLKGKIKPTLYQSGVEKVVKGITSLDEFVRVVGI
ncbi:MAG: type II/IV secretion system protein [Candidatus Doudnabacteria bacterium]|nr:type II/IV secretion system protein [Candidatus Doudnabacteria bacterium]